MRSALVLSAVLVLAGVLQSSLTTPEGKGPDLLLLIALLAGWMHGAEAGAVAGLAAGVFTASLHSGGMGGFIVSRAGAAYMLGRLREEVYGDRPLVMAFSCALATGLSAGLHILWQPPRGEVSWGLIPLQALLNGALSLALYPILRAASGSRKREDRFL